MGVKAAFLDRDGVINIDHGYVFRPEDFTPVPGAIEACRQLKDAGFALVIITNQSGIARGMYTEADLLLLNDFIRKRFQEAYAPLSGIYSCPHLPDAPLARYRCLCDCRKPAPGLFFKAAKELDIDLSQSIAFGDKPRDLIAAQAAGVSTRIMLGKDGSAPPLACESATGAAKSLRDYVESLKRNTR